MGSPKTELDPRYHKCHSFIFGFQTALSKEPVSSHSSLQSSSNALPIAYIAYFLLGDFGLPCFSSSFAWNFSSTLRFLVSSILLSVLSLTFDASSTAGCPFFLLASQKLCQYLLFFCERSWSSLNLRVALLVFSGEALDDKYTTDTVVFKTSSQFCIIQSNGQDFVLELDLWIGAPLQIM